MSKGTHAPADLPLPLLRQGKVREVYDLGGEELLMVASDRVSAFDVVLPQLIPHKGRVLTQLTAWWLADLEGRGVEHHLIAVDTERIVELHPMLGETATLWSGRAMLVRRTDPLPVECVVRGYLSGSAWQEYQASGTLAGEPLQPQLVESQELEQALFSPATKARDGHDENITPTEAKKLLGQELAERLEQTSLEIYAHGRETCEQRGILLADTKFEFGLDAGGRLLLIDEVMTPDSSRFWPKEHYRVGHGQPSLDKQPIRDWLDSLPDWDKTPPPPDLPPAVVEAASRRYREIFRRLTGRDFDSYHPPDFGNGQP